MNPDDEFLEETTETGSDDLLADDDLRLPDSANNLVRVHAIRAWLTRRQKETSMEIGEAALALQQALQEEPQESRLRRRERQLQTKCMQHQQHALLDAQQRMHAYEEAEALLEECISHTTTGERVLVEYYLTLEELAENATPENETEHSSWLQALEDVQHRVEHVGSPNEE
ncbi:MAG: hypothetical protein JO215_09430 [Ktedonobacteraceae bacterium]|nr:hypothetical protein [Ktedonobacteraceae bacterium]MBV9616079.1 hypothetical protein [Ktedonobacteraceae bacterium]MBV9712718.1 hypothetical protein [Ktedonobacteraceae bacterium]